MVDGAENNLPSFYTSKHYEVCKYFSKNEHTSIPDILVIGTLTWNKLNEQEKGWLMEAVEEATVLQRKLWEDAEREALTEIKKAGVQIIYPDKSLFEEKAKPMLQSLKEKNGHLYKLVQEIKSTE